MKTQLSRECLLDYWWSEALWLILTAGLCLSLLILAWWHHALSDELLRLQMQWRQTVRHHPVLRATKPQATSIERAWLYPQLIVLDRVFGGHVRLKSMEWKSGSLTIQGEADSVLHFSQTWDRWQKQGGGVKSQLESYGYKERPFFKVTIPCHPGCGRRSPLSRVCGSKVSVIQGVRQQSLRHPEERSDVGIHSNGPGKNAD